MPPPFAARGRGLKTEIRESMHMADQKIDGALFKSMVIEGALAIAENKERANELNVFPVPDGDTGTNMSMTMASAMTELDKLEEPTLAKAFGFPADYGRTLDALYDLLTACPPARLTLRHAEKLVDNMGNYGELLLRVLADAAAENPSFVLSAE